MNLIEYQEKTQRTRAELENRHMNVCHMLLGITGEWFSEVDTESKDLEEIGDTMWYLSELSNIIGHEISLIAHRERGSLTTINTSIGKLNEYYKKYMAYNKPLNIPEFTSHIDNIAYMLSFICDPHHMIKDDKTVPDIRDINDCPRFMECLSENIEKLKKRYPDKFTMKDALSRKDVSAN